MLNEAQCNIVLTRITDAKLVTVNRDAGVALISLDAHPLLREYFAKQLRETRPEVVMAAHGRLDDHLTAKPQKPAPTLEDLQPLYQAVAHGCHGEWSRRRAIRSILSADRLSLARAIAQNRLRQPPVRLHPWILREAPERGRSSCAPTVSQMAVGPSS